jgi:4-hydroxybenzoate polyprenyltransferase
MFDRLKTYSRFVKLEHSIFAFPMILAGVLLPLNAAQVFQNRLFHDVRWWWHLAMILLAGVGARTAGFAWNRIVDAKIDALNPRTVTRELPAGRMTTQEAAAVCFSGLLLYFVMAYQLLRFFGIVVGLIPIFVFAIYPWLKRFTAWAHFGVGLALSLAPLGGWLAVSTLLWPPMNNDMDPSFIATAIFRSFNEVISLALFTFFWVSGFDIIYSTMDEAFDREQKLHSLPAKLGRRKALSVSAMLHGVAFLALLFLYGEYFRTWLSGLLLAAVGVLLFLEQRFAENVDLAFFKINGVISFVVLGMVWAGVAQR